MEVGAFTKQQQYFRMAGSDDAKCELMQLGTTSCVSIFCPPDATHETKSSRSLPSKFAHRVVVMA